MESAARYHLLMDTSENRVMIFDTATGRLQHPACGRDIAAYFHYRVARNRLAEAQDLLADSMSGCKPMTRMVESAWDARKERAP